MGKLSVVATPIGNLEDVTARAKRVLSECDAIVAEDSRRTRALLSAYQISKEIISMPAFDEARRAPKVLKRLNSGQHLALVTDAGTPAISDPGTILVALAREQGDEVEVIPGPSALTAALSGCGLNVGNFVFLGFLPRSPGKMRRTVETALSTGFTVVFFEAAVRLPRTMRTLTEVMGEREVVVARELTKVHETFHRGIGVAVLETISDVPKGECTVLIEGGKR